MREFSAPATFAIGEDESVVGAVFDFAEADPGLVVFLRKSGAGGRTSRRPSSPAR